MTRLWCLIFWHYKKGINRYKGGTKMSTQEAPDLPLPLRCTKYTATHWIYTYTFDEWENTHIKMSMKGWNNSCHKSHPQHRTIQLGRNQQLPQLFSEEQRVWTTYLVLQLLTLPPEGWASRTPDSVNQQGLRS